MLKNTYFGDFCPIFNIRIKKQKSQKSKPKQKFLIFPRKFTVYLFLHFKAMQQHILNNNNFKQLL